jgi:hypothetical protein
MDERLRRVLILDTDPDTLLSLQRVLEHANFDTTISWDETEARRLLAGGSFDLIIIGDHPPELDAAAILHDFGWQGLSSLILRGTVLEKDIEYFSGLSAVGVAPRRNPLMVLEQVTRALSPMLFQAIPEKAGLAHANS